MLARRLLDVRCQTIAASAVTTCAYDGVMIGSNAPGALRWGRQGVHEDDMSLGPTAHRHHEVRPVTSMR